MNRDFIIKELNSNKFLFEHLIENLEPELIYWKPAEDKWNILDIVCHLYDEEREDFRARLKSTLKNPKSEFKAIDPVGWVLSRNYAAQDLSSRLEEFIYERGKSIEFLQQLIDPQWDNFYEHPKFGKLTVKMFFTNWLAHDYLHLKQIIKIKFDYLSHTTSEKLNYAGEWK